MLSSQASCLFEHNNGVSLRDAAAILVNKNEDSLLKQAVACSLCSNSYDSVPATDCYVRVEFLKSTTLA